MNTKTLKYSVRDKVHTAREGKSVYHACLCFETEKEAIAWKNVNCPIRGEVFCESQHYWENK